MAGIIAFAAPIAAIFLPKYAAQLNTVASLAAGSGLMAARDNKVSSDDLGINPKPTEPKG